MEKIKRSDKRDNIDYKKERKVANRKEKEKKRGVIIMPTITTFLKII